MVRKGRDLELLVALLEEHLGPLGIEVRSPDYIPDKDTSQPREVDISLRSQIGSSNILVIVECRNRKGDEDVTWIEQLSKKRESVGADKAVAVSSSGFTEPAILKATRENIELRILNEIDPKEIGKWFEDTEGIYLIGNVLFKDLSFTLFDGSKIDGKGIDLNSPIFKRKKDGKELSLRDFWIEVPRPIFYADVPEDGTHVERKIKINYVLEGETSPKDAIEELDNLQLITKRGIIDLKEMYIVADLWLDAKKIPAKAKHYEKSNGTIVEIVEFEYENKGKKYSLAVMSGSNSDRKTICMIPKGHENPEIIDISFKATKPGETLGKSYYGRLGKKL